MNLGIHIITVFICFSTLAASAFSTKYRNHITDLLLIVIALNGIDAVFEPLCYNVNKYCFHFSVPFFQGSTFVTYVNDYLQIGILFYAIYCSFKEYMLKRERYIPYLFILYYVFLWIMLFLNLFTRWLYYFDEHGAYYLGSYYFVTFGPISVFLIEKMCSVDMFPHTANVETVALLSRKHIDSERSVDVTIKPEEGWRVDKPVNATYGQIKEWVAKNYEGMNVSSLYIAQVKQKYGLIERENYNKGKEGTRVPQCPEEKMEAIEAALRYFKLI